MSPLLRKLVAHQWWLTGVLVALVIFGIRAVAMAGENNPSEGIREAYRTQTLYAVVGFAVYMITSLVNYRWWVRLAALPAMAAGIGLLVYTLVFGKEINDTKGWIELGPVTFQPSQFAMAAAILAVSVALGELRKLHGFFRLPFINLAMVGGLMGVPCLLVLLQGDVGSALVWLPVSAALCLVGNIPFRHLALVALAAMTVIPPFYFFALTDSRRERIESYFDALRGEEMDTRGRDYAAHHVTMAVGSGGWNGFESAAQSARERAVLQGQVAEASAAELKNSVHAQGLIPRNTVHTDFIFAVVAERYGFRGSALLIFGYCCLLAICLTIAYGARDLTGRLIVTGVAALVFAHMFQNIGMNVLLTPITGIPLPFISYGGTFLLTLLFLMGMVQSVWIHREPEPEKEAQPEPRRSLRPLSPHLPT